MHLIDRVRRTIRDHGLAHAATRVVAGVSGGSDSVALAHLLKQLHASGELVLAGICHFDHQLRPSSAEDALVCRGVADALGVPFLAEGGDVRGSARRDRRSIEHAARVLRHAFFERARVHFDADRVALGHTRDDQAETFLLRLLRGAGARGLGGMHPSRGALIRPLLECRRQALREYLQHLGVNFVHDESNDDVAIPRNRVRAELLPMLERRFNPAIVDALAAASDVAREEWRWLQDVAGARAAELCRRDGSRWTIDAVGLGQLPVAVARVVLRNVMVEAAAGHPVSFRHVEDVRRLARLGGAPIHGPRLFVDRTGDLVVLTGREPSERGRPHQRTAGPAGGHDRFAVALPVPGEATVEAAGVMVTAEIAPPGVDWRAVLATGEAAAVRLDRVQGPLTVRGRRPGDRFRPFGLGHWKKLQDFLVDRKAARQGRDLVPIVTDTTGRIVWVGGYEIDEEFAVTDSAQAVLILRLKVVGGLA